jgi:AraC-like DNA-binding protein
MFISTVVVRALVAELENRGVNAERVLRAGGLERSALERPAHGVRFRDFDRMVRQALELSDDPGLGLAIGMRAPETMLNVLGMLLVTSRTIRAAFEHLRTYGALVAGGIDWELRERSGRRDLTSFGYVCAGTGEAGQDTARFGADCALSLALRLGRHFAPVDPPVELLLCHSEPSYFKRYAQLFGCPVHFRQPINALVFKTALLDRPQPHADPLLCSMLESTAAKLHEELRGARSFVDRVRTALCYETDLANVDFDALARSWGLTRRVLRRRLSAENLSLSELLDEARCRRAVDELGRPESKIKDVAEDLGYSETSAFHRAFKRWTGRTPSDYKAELQSGVESSRLREHVASAPREHVTSATR